MIVARLGGLIPGDVACMGRFTKSTSPGVCPGPRDECSRSPRMTPKPLAPTHTDCCPRWRKSRTWRVADSSRLGNTTSRFAAWNPLAGTPVPRGRGTYIELDGIGVIAQPYVLGGSARQRAVMPSLRHCAVERVGNATQP